MTIRDIPGYESLSTQEKLELITEIYEEISQSNEGIPVPDWQLDELKRRREREVSGSTYSWAEVIEHARRSQPG